MEPWNGSLQTGRGLENLTQDKLEYKYALKLTNASQNYKLYAFYQK